MKSTTSFEEETAILIAWQSGKSKPTEAHRKLAREKVAAWNEQRIKKGFRPFE